MDREKVLGIIKKKIAEHKYEMDMSQLNNESIQRELSKAKESLLLDRKDVMMRASNLVVLKDKAMFHKACVAVLEDVLSDLKKLED